MTYAERRVSSLSDHEEEANLTFWVCGSVRLCSKRVNDTTRATTFRCVDHVKRHFTAV